MKVLHLLLAAAIAIATGCASTQNQPSADLAKSPLEILRRVEANQSKVRTLSGRGRLIVEMPKAQFAGHAQIYVKRPDSLFISAKAILGVDVGFFFANRQHFSSYSPLENTFYSGPTQHMDKLILFEMKIEYDRLMDSVLGTAQFSPSEDLQVRVQDGKYVFEQTYRKHHLLYEVDPKHFVVTRVELKNAAGEVIGEQVFSRFRKVQGVWLPKHIRFLRPKTRERLIIYYEKVQINKPIPPEKFTFKVPENARRMILKKRKH